MEDSILHISNSWKKLIESKIQALKKVINNYNLYYISNLEQITQNQTILQGTNISKIAIIKLYIHDNQNDGLFILCFSNIILICKKTKLKLLEPFFSNLIDLKIYFLTDTKNIFNENIKIPNDQYEYTYIEEMYSLNNEFYIESTPKKCDNEILNNLLSCITGYLILKSYSELRLNQTVFFTPTSSQKSFKRNEIAVWNTTDFISLKMLGIGSSFKTELILYLESQQLFVIKKPNGNEEESIKLIKRENKNYEIINHPFIPKIYAKTKDSNNQIIQFIIGQTLYEYEKNQLNFEDIIKIILELMIVINYLHQNEFVYRDLKPDNIMIDENKNIYLIDFDRMIQISNKEENQLHTMNFCSNFVAPEVNSGIISYKNDVFSLGQIIYYLIDETNNFNSNLQILYKKCIEKTIDKRPSLFMLMYEFCGLFLSSITKISFIKNCPEINFILGILYLEGKHVPQDYYKSISYLSLVANQNHLQAQYSLAIIYQEGKTIPRNINKSIHYFSLAAEQNDVNSQYYLGVIYYEEKLIKRDINKAIHYFLLAANQKHSEAQFNLGVIYAEGKFVERDINKAIHYYSLASNQNNAKAQFNLGNIYLLGKFIKRDINKAIHYFLLAANLNEPDAQYNLANIYIGGEYIKQDINKAIYYYSLSANQNYTNAQFNLGNIYHEGKYVKQDIYKAIYYYTLAANNNHSEAQHNLAVIYLEGKYIKQDINKAIQYFQLSAYLNNSESQYNLAVIYYEGKYIKQDINKSIYYYTLAANQCNSKAQFNLGVIYHKSKYINQDINKAIYYYELSSNQNNPKAQFNLGVIYYEGKYIKQDIDKAIYYFSLASKQNDSNAQFNLGVYYYDNKYITRDIIKAIHYFQLSSDQNNPQAQYYLGIIFEQGKYITRDLYKAIHYFKLAADQNLAQAQFQLGLIYCKDENKTQNISKSIYYFKLAANQNMTQAQFNLGIIYYSNKYFMNDINKSIHYFQLAADRNLAEAQFELGLIYTKGEYINQDINKAIHYFQLASKQNHSDAQLQLGYFYSLGFHVKKNMIKAIDYIIQSSSNRNIKAHFAAGFFYQEGKFIDKNIIKSIYHYKEASSFNNQFAKNNLGIIYKNGFDDVIQINITLAIEYFDEAICRFNDILSIYNLSHIFIYEDKTSKKIDQSIELLIKSINQNFLPSQHLLCIALIKKHGFDLKRIKKNLDERSNRSYNLTDKICQLIVSLGLNNESNFELFYLFVKQIDFLYDFSLNAISSLCLKNQDQSNKINYISHFNITKDFYDGFGIDI